MSDKVDPKIRVVRCPKCRQLLEEPLEHDVYQCGGCGTNLQAKKQSVAVNSKSSIQEIDAAPGNALGLVSKDKQRSDRNHHVPPRKDRLKAKATTSGECYLDGNVGRGQKENGEYNGSQLVPFKLSDEEQEIELDIYKLSLRRHRVYNKGGSHKTTQCEIEEIDNGNFSLEKPKEELVCALNEDGNDDKSGLIGVRSEMEITGSNLQGAQELNKENLSLEGANEELISGSDEEDANKEKSVTAGGNPEVEITGSDLGGVEDLNNDNLSLGDVEEELIYGLDGEDANNDKSALVGENLEGQVTGYSIAGEKLNNGKWLPEGAEKDLTICALDGEDPNNDQSTMEEAKSEVDMVESTSTTEKPSTDQGSILHVTPGKLEGMSGNPVSPKKQQKQAQMKIHHSSDSVRCVDTLDTTESRDHSSELSGVLGKLFKSPATRSSRAYDGIGSLSSHDGMDKRKNAYIVSEGRTRKGKGLANSSLYGDLGTQHQSHMSNEKHHVIKESRRNQNKVLEITSWMRTKRGEFPIPSRLPSHRSGSESPYESGMPSNGMHDELNCSSSFLSHNSHEDTDQEKMKLLRMIYKLQDQLNKTRYMNGETIGRQSKTTGVSYKGNHIPSYHSHDLHEGRFSHAMEHPRCNGRCSHGVMWHQRHKYSRIPYSAEATSSSCAHHFDHSCFHCCPHVTADSPPRVFQHEDLYRSYSGQDCYTSHHSYSSSPQWLTASKLPLYGGEATSDDQRHRAKRRQRPIVGGAPFVTCHKCLKLLQLPVDFLLYKKACHQLKCGECSELLKFSLKNGSHIVSFSSNAIGLPSRELHDQSEVISGSNLPSASHASYYQYSPAKPISYYDDYGLSFSQSYSSEQFHPLHGSVYDNPTVSPSTTVKEKIASRYSSTAKAPMETDESAADLSSNVSESRKFSAEMVARPQPKNSLHKLMGYSTPSQVIRGTSIEGTGAHTQFRN